MKSLLRLTDLDEYPFIIKWRMTEVCNYKCSYCIHPYKTLMDLDSVPLKETAVKLNNMLNRCDIEAAKIDLIGGEVSVLDLHDILSVFDSPKLKAIQLTTNFSQPKEYYTTLSQMLTEKGIKLILTCSFHYEFETLDTYFKKILYVKDYVSDLTCEMVSLTENQDLCKEFISRCEENKLSYMVEADLRESNDKQVLIHSGNKVVGPRYRAEFDDGSVKEYMTRNAFIIDKDVKENFSQRAIRTGGFYCSDSSNFVYVKYDHILGRKEGSDRCNNYIDIDDFKRVTPFKCKEGSVCTICGHYSLWK